MWITVKPAVFILLGKEKESIGFIILKSHFEFHIQPVAFLLPGFIHVKKARFVLKDNAEPNESLEWKGGEEGKGGEGGEGRA